MTRIRAKEIIPVLQAYSDGKEVQVKRMEDTEWLPYFGTNLDAWNENWVWRVKPEPRVWWACQGNPACYTYLFTTEEAAKVYAGTFNCPPPIIKVQEVL